MFHRYVAAMLVCIATGSPLIANASSDDAWAELRETLVTTCDALARKVTPDAEIRVTPNEVGSESYAVALVTVSTEAGQDMSVCVYDKQKKTAELTVAFLPVDE